VPKEASVPVLESVSPNYQCYPITVPSVVRPDDLKVALEEWEKRDDQGSRVSLRQVLGGEGRSPSYGVGLNPRARGVGFEQGRPYRWEPLLGAYDTGTQDYRGAVGALVAHVEPPLRGSVWAVFTPAELASTGRGGEQLRAAGARADEARGVPE